MEGMQSLSPAPAAGSPPARDRTPLRRRDPDPGGVLRPEHAGVRRTQRPGR